MSENKPLQPARQTDWEAANSAEPDTDRQPSWDDVGWDAYLYAVDLNYRVDWDIAHGVDPDDVQAMIDDWYDGEDDEEGGAG